MFFYTTGDLLQSDAEALVNTVNCEGIWERESPINLNLNFQTTTKTMLRRVKMVHYVPENFMFIRKVKKSSLISQPKINGVKNHEWNILRMGWMRLFY